MNRGLRKIVRAIIRGIVREAVWLPLRAWLDDDDQPDAP